MKLLKTIVAVMAVIVTVSCTGSKKTEYYEERGS
jgi:hypothetical protein